MNNRTSSLTSSFISLAWLMCTFFGFFMCCGICGGAISIEKVPKKDYITPSVKTNDTLLEQEQIMMQEAHDEQQYQKLLSMIII